MISGMYQSFDLPSIHSLTLDRHDLYSVPRLYHRSSDGSEPDSPTGGGGSFNPHVERSTQNTHRQIERRVTDTSFVDFDAPYVPPRQFGPSPREQSGVDYFTSGTPLFPQRSGYNSAGSSARYQYEHSASDLSSRGFDPRGLSRSGPQSEPSRTGLDFGQQWRALPQGQFRTHPPIYPGDDMGRTASSSHSSHSSSGLPLLPPLTGVFDTHDFGHPATGSDSPFPDAGDYLRAQLNIGPGERVDLRSLPTPPDGQKPPQPLPVLIKLAIYGSPRKRLTLQEIYTALENRFQWFSDHRNDTAWKNSIRHNLSLNKVFRNTARPITEPGKGSYWELDISGGEGYKRERKRRKKASSAQSAQDDDEGSDDNEEGSTSPPDTHIEANLDPQPSNDAHSVGPVRLRSNSRRNSPYLSPSPPMAARQTALEAPGALHSSSGSSSPAGSNASIPSVPSLPGSFVQQPRFGQSSFAQTPFGQPSFNQPMMGQPSFEQRPTFGASGFPSAQPTPPTYNQSSMVSGMYSSASSTSTAPGLYWPSQDQFTTFLPDSSLPQGSTPGLQGPSQASQLNRSQSAMFLPQGSGTGQGRGRGV